MVEIYATEVPSFINSDLLEELFLYLDENRVERLRKFRFKEDLYRTLISDILSRVLICRKLGNKLHTLKFEKNENGKPFIAGKSIYFNNSHSGKWVVCGISFQDIGVDVEVIKNIDLNIAKRFFHNLEYEELVQKDTDEKLDFFFRLWTLKESFIKADGRGLSLGLDSFHILANSRDIRAVYLGDLTKYKLKVYDFVDGYKLSVCSESGLFSKTVEFIYFKDVVDEFMFYVGH
jgi:4'-phosphopantetheinyl transferase